MLEKPNNEAIPVYVIQDNLEKITKDLERQWNKDWKKSENKWWKLALATNLKVWIVYGLNTLSSQPTQISYEFARRDASQKN